MADDQPEPWFRVVAGRPTDEELAALTIALRLASAPAEAGPGGWVGYWRTVTAPPAAPGPRRR